MKTVVHITTLFLALFWLGSAIEPCKIFILDALNLSNTSTTADPPAYQTMSELAGNLSQIMSSADGATCKELGVVVYPSNYVFHDQVSFDGNEKSYSLIFNTSADSSSEDAPITFTFENQSNLKFQNLAHLRIQNITFVFDTQSVNSFMVTNTPEVIISNTNTRESQPNTGTDSQMRILNVNSLTIDSMKINSLLSPNFLEINGQYATIGLINITNLAIEYAVTQASQALFLQQTEPCALFINSSSVLTITNISVVSPKNDATNLPITTSFLSKLLYILNSNDVSIWGFYARELISNYYGYWCKFQSITKLTFGNINLTQNTLQSSGSSSMFDILNVKQASIQSVEISHNSLQLPEWTTFAICFFNFTMPNVKYSEIVMKDLLFTNMSQANALVVAGEFLYFNMSTARFTDLAMRSAHLMEIATSHKDIIAFATWFFNGKTSQSHLENILFDNITLRYSDLMHFRHNLEGLAFNYLTYGEAVIANLDKITFSRIDGKSDINLPNGLVQFTNVKSVMRHSTYSNLSLFYQSPLYSSGEASLIVDNLTVSNTVGESANIIYQPVSFKSYSGAQLMRNPLSPLTIQPITGLPLYRVLSVQNSHFRNLSLKVADLFATRLPFILLVNNTFTNISMAYGFVLFSPVPEGLNTFTQFNFNGLNRNDTYVGPLLGPEIANYKSVLMDFSIDPGFYLMIYMNSFSSITFNQSDGLFYLIKSQTAKYLLLLQQNTFLNISGMAVVTAVTLEEFATLKIADNRVANFSSSSTSTFLSIQASTNVNITQNQFNDCVSGGSLITVKSETSSLLLQILKNNFTRAFVNATELISLGFPTTFEMVNNNFISCTLAVGFTSTLVNIFDTQAGSELRPAVAVLENNHFNDTKILTLRSNSKRSFIVKIRNEYSSAIIYKGVFMNANSGPIQNLAVFDVGAPALEIADTQVIGYSGGVTNFGNFIQIQAADILLENCVFDEIHFHYPNIIETNFIYISSFQERNINMTVVNTNFTNISLNKTNLIRGGWVESFSLLFERCFFTNIDWQNRLFDITASPLNASFVDTVFNVSKIADPYSEPTAIAIAQPNNTLSFQRSVIILGTLNAAAFIKYTGSSGGKISFAESFILNLQSYNMISNNQTSNQSTTPARFLQENNGTENSTHQHPLMRLLTVQGNCNVTFTDSLIDYQGATTSPPVFTTTSDFSLEIQNTTFRNMIVIPDMVTPRAIYSDYFDTYGRYLGGVINILISPAKLDSDEQTIKIIVNGSTFVNFSSNSTGILSILNRSPTTPFSMEILDSSFEDLQSKYGPMMTLLLPYSVESFQTAGALSIVKSRIVSTAAELLGGAIFNNMSGNISIKQLTSSQNKMNDIDNLLYDTTESSSSWNLTQLNQIQILGTPKLLTYIISAENSNSGINVSKCPESNVLCISNASSYSLASVIITVTILDSSSRIFSDPSQIAAITLSCLAKNYSSSSFKCSEGVCQIDNIDFVLTGQANESIDLDLSYSSEYASLTNFTRISLRTCLVGEYNNTILGTCEYCPAGNYSLGTSSPCKPCSSNATCQGGSYFAPVSGYWRTNTSTDKLYKCDDSQGRCLGKFNSECLTGYKGPLCLQCDYENSYGASDNSSGCNKCPENTTLLVLIRLLIWILPFLYAVYVFWKQKALNELKTQEEDDDSIRVTIKQAVYIDLLITYSQIMSIVLTFKGGFKEVLSILGGGGAAASYSDLFYPEVCLYIGSDNDCKGCISAAFVLATPIIQWFLLAFYYLAVVYRFKFTWKRVRRFLLMGVTFYLLYYPSICDRLIKLLHCTNFGLEGGDMFMLTDPNVSCTSPSYISFTNYIALPALIIWSVAIPAAFIISIRCFRNHPIAIRQIFGQLINPYKADKYYWSLGVMLLKFALIIASNFSDGDSKFRALSMIILLYLYKWLEGYLEPYADPKVVIGVRLSLYAYITTIFFSYFYPDNTDFMKIICMLATIVMNVVGLGYILSFIIANMYEKIISVLKSLQKRFFSKSTINPDFSNDEENEKEGEVTQKNITSAKPLEKNTTMVELSLDDETTRSKYEETL